MRRRTALLLVLSVFVLVLGGLTSSQAACTLAGSCKSSTANITCGNTGKLADVGAVKIYANTNPNQTELEACSDQAGNQNGRLVLRANHNTGNPAAVTNGVRLSLDSDDSQQPSNVCCSYINVQAGQQGTGVWCGEDGNPNGVPGDGYSQSWAVPGQDGTAGNEGSDTPGPAECIPTQ